MLIKYRKNVKIGGEVIKIPSRKFKRQGSKTQRHKSKVDTISQDKYICSLFLVLKFLITESYSKDLMKRVQDILLN